MHHSRRHASLVERLSHALQGGRDHAGEAGGGGLTEIFRGRALAGGFIAGLRYARPVVGEDGVELLLDVFGHD
jgi:hypothetical protein